MNPLFILGMVSALFILISIIFLKKLSWYQDHRVKKGMILLAVGLVFLFLFLITYSLRFLEQEVFSLSLLQIVELVSLPLMIVFFIVAMTFFLEKH